MIHVSHPSSDDVRFATAKKRETAKRQEMNGKRSIMRRSMAVNDVNDVDEQQSIRLKQSSKPVILHNSDDFKPQLQ